MKKTVMRKYARLIARVGANVQKGQVVQLTASVDQSEFVAILVDECYKLYGGQPGDDATACVVRIRKREPMNLLFGPPASRDDNDRMMSLFFSK